jgi:sugar (pentulose or hexulose) kinase
VDLLIGLDVGTSAVKGVLVSAEGLKLASARRATRLLRPASGWVELDPEEHYRSVCELLRELGSHAPPGARVRALAMAAASGNALLTDAGGRPLTNILSWLDTRSVGHFAELVPGFDADSVRELTGWPFGEVFPLAQLAWLRRHEPEAWRGAAHVCMNTDWLLYRLCGRWGMDPSTATTFYLCDQRTGTWHRPYLERLGIRERQLSALAPSGRVLGGLTARAVRDTGLPRGTLAVLGCFDHPGAARGTGVLEPGGLLLSCGTSWVGFYPSADRGAAVARGHLVDPFLAPAGPWGCMFALTAISVTIEKYIDHFLLAPGEEPARKYALFNELAARVPPGAGGLRVDLYRSWFDFLNEVRNPLDGHPREHLARALMEGAAFVTRRNLEELDQAGIPDRRLVMVGGPAESPVWPRIVAEVAGHEILLLHGQHAGAMGAAMLAAIGAGLHRGEAEAFAAMGGRAVRIEPDPEAVRRYEGIYREQA